MDVKKMVLGAVVILLGVVALVFAWGDWSQIRAASAEPQEITVQQLIERGPSGPSRVLLTDFGFVDVKVAHAKPDSDQWAVVYIPLTVKGAQKGDPVKVVFKSRHLANQADWVELLKKNKLDVTVVPNNETTMSEKNRAALKEQLPNRPLGDFILVEDRYEPSKTTAGVLSAAAALFLLLGSVVVVRGLRGDVG